MTVLSSKSFTEVNQKNRREKGPLVKVQIGPGQYVKMYRADAIAAGHLSEKTRPPAENKLRPPEDDKRQASGPERDAVSVPPVSFTDIPGVGRATVRLLAGRGITTLDQLRQADLSFLPASARAAVEAWKGV